MKILNISFFLMEIEVTACRVCSRSLCPRAMTGCTYLQAMVMGSIRISYNFGFSRILLDWSDWTTLMLG